MKILRVLLAILIAWAPIGAATPQRPPPALVGGATGSGAVYPNLVGTDGTQFVTNIPEPVTITGSALMTASFTSIAGTVINITSGAANLYGWAAFNPHSAVCYLQIFDLAAADVTIGVTAPTIVIPVATLKDNTSIASVPTYAFATRMSAASTTTVPGSTTCTLATPTTFFTK